MKKLILIFGMLFMFAFANAQYSYTFTPTTNDSLVGAVTKYCTLSKPITQAWVGSIEVYITPSLSNSDSTHVWIEGSQNNSTWYKLSMGTPYLNVGTYYATNATYLYKARMGTTAASWLWQPTWFITPPYLRVAVQHFIAGASVKITRATIYLKK
jgi:hypothetical protein